MAKQSRGGDEAMAATIADAVTRFPKFTDEQQSPYDDARTTYLLKLSGLVEARVQFESGWISQRMTWLVISQSFLFGAFATCAANMHKDKPILAVAASLIPIVAAIQVTVTYLSIVAAKLVSGELSRMRGTVDAAIRGCCPGMSNCWTILGRRRFGLIRWTHNLGALSSHVIPITLAIAWVWLRIKLG